MHAGIPETSMAASLVTDCALSGLSQVLAAGWLPFLVGMKDPTTSKKYRSCDQQQRRRDMLRVTWRPHHSLRRRLPGGRLGKESQVAFLTPALAAWTLLCWGSVSHLPCGLWRRLRSSLLGIASIAAD